MDELYRAMDIRMLNGSAQLAENTTIRIFRLQPNHLGYGTAKQKQKNFSSWLALVNQIGDRSSTTQTVSSVSRIQTSTFTVEGNVVRQVSTSVQSCSDVTIPAMTNATIKRLFPLTNGVLSVLSETCQRDVRGNETVQKVVQDPTTYVRTTTVSNATSVLPAISVSLAGLTLSQTDQHGCTTTNTYDALMRQISAETRSGASDERLTGSYTHYNALGQIDYTEDALGTRTVYGYEPATGRRISTTQYGQGSDPALTTYTAFDAANRTLATWGATYPVAYEYDTAGRMTAMYTYRGTNETEFINSIRQSGNNAIRQSADCTRWLYDEATGLLTNKLYADNRGPSYSYTALGQLSTRKWARLYGQGSDPAPLLTLYAYDSFGSLTNILYSDSTPIASFTYDAMGRQKVAQTFLSATGELISCTTNIYSGLDLVAEIQNGVRIDRQVDAFGRPKGLVIGQDYAVEYGFDEYGRFKSVQSAQSVDTNLFTYSYLPGSHLLKGYTATQPVSSFEFQVSKSYEPNRDLITTVSNTFSTATISAFGYENDAFGRRTARVDTTPTLTVNNAFGYNLKSEVTSATMANGESSYEYDPIGNRVFSSLNALTNTYSANALNQYAVITNSVTSVPPCLIEPAYDFDGNMLTNGVWSYSWDGENRLTAVYSNDTLLVSNVYDHQSRRIAKTVFEITQSGNNAIRQFSFLWDDWNMVSEIRSQISEVSTNYYVWGLDLSGTLQGAGGVGGLLAVTRDAYVYFQCFDVNGNGTEYVDATGTIRAHYAFDAFGNTISQRGDLATTFSHRFSTKYYDAETDLVMYQLRAYSPELGRWINRDPVEEEGGVNLFVFVDNAPTLYADMIGLLKAGEGYDDAGRTCCISDMKEVKLNHLCPLSEGHLVGHSWIGLPEPIPVPGHTNLTQHIGYYPAGKYKITHLQGRGKWKDDTKLSDREGLETESFKVCPSTLELIKNNIKDNPDEGYNLGGIGCPNCRTMAEQVFKDAGLHPKGGGYEPGAFGPRKAGCILFVSF